jgi:hypothetical protein
LTPGQALAMRKAPVVSNRCSSTRVALALTCLVLSGSAVRALDAPVPTTFTVADGSRLWLEGDSTMHRFSSTASHFDVAAELVPVAADPRAAVVAGGLKGLRVSVPVSGLKSGEEGLDKNLRKTLKEDKAPAIVFTLIDYQTEESKDGALVIKAHGRLAIAGVEKEMVVEAACRFNGKDLDVSGAKDVLMSDYGIKPPTMMLGAVKTADKVTVRFALKLKASDAAPAKH